MHPVSTLLLFVGYALCLPIVARLPQVRSQQHRIALIGHQVGVLVAAVGWLLRGRVGLAVLHLVWAIGARVWFQTAAGASK